ncbi:AmmeMemoRadiSam system protein B [Candidatus Saccharibacteria bacterium]|nr:AmmeMemoRadiSam system protein B [Candidatus Saccharibacteria bacterium]NIV04043.1 AmmeMemoRadiSam system protein B [Calditrichia bacterium]NIV72420.1 AmmeMemoRadiSam system protein B [Calditrichia bacterium]NIV99497.1 AmmeMemoRadiSam system protein B [Candidatus Saccharibacteria bacterium]NIW79789.1 AmmeMemoRadiSam system protein B [Calditrichia bacterium]
MPNRDQVRPVGVAGEFFPLNKDRLESKISFLLENAPQLSFPRPIRAMIVPHAAYTYSGGVAARAFRQIMHHHYELIVVIALSHSEKYAYTSLYPGKAFQTPLGNIALDVNFIDQLVTVNSDILLSVTGFAPSEHTIEVHLPFLMWMAHRAKLVPMMMGMQESDVIQSVYTALSEALKNKNFLIIASSDLSHYHPDEKARTLDQVVMENVEHFAPDQLYVDIKKRKCEMCSYGPTIVAMKVAKALGATEGRLLLYRNSGDINGDLDKVVGYLSAVFY